MTFFPYHCSKSHSDILELLTILWTCWSLSFVVVVSSECIRTPHQHALTARREWQTPKSQKPLKHLKIISLQRIWVSITDVWLTVPRSCPSAIKSHRWPASYFKGGGLWCALTTVMMILWDATPRTAKSVGWCVVDNRRIKCSHMSHPQRHYWPRAQSDHCLGQPCNLRSRSLGKQQCQTFRGTFF